MDAPQGQASGVRGTFCCSMFICQRNPASISAQACGSHDSRASWGLPLWGSSVQIICLRNVLHRATLSGFNVSFAVSSVPSISSHAWKKKTTAWSTIHQIYYNSYHYSSVSLPNMTVGWFSYDSHLSGISWDIQALFSNSTSVLP